MGDDKYKTHYHYLNVIYLINIFTHIFIYTYGSFNFLSNGPILECCGALLGWVESPTFMTVQSWNYGKNNCIFGTRNLAYRFVISFNYYQIL
jgi:hypothetical protein